MSQAPRWRYTRKAVSPVEKVLSLAVLLVLAGIAALYLWDMTRPIAASPFSVDAKLLSDAARPAGTIAAGYLLPSSASAKRMNLPQVASPQTLADSNADLAQAAQAAKLKQVLLADYDVAGSSLSAAVIDCQAPDRALNLWTARKTPQATTQAIGGAGQAWRTDSGAAFAAGRYYVEIWADKTASPKMAKPGVVPTSTGPDGLAILLAELSKSHVFSKPAAPGKATSPQAAVVAQDGPLPKLAGPDVTGPGEIRHFNPDTLYEKIDGKAQLYLSYNFAELLFTTYAADDVSLDVYVYDMSQADNAFGIFKAEQGEEAETAPVGREGYYSGSSVFFWKGKYYVNVLASAATEEEAAGEAEQEGMSGDQARPIALKLAKAIANQLQDAGQSLWAEQVLPADNRVAGSFEFRKSDAFGLDFLKDVFSAQYKQDGQEMTLFVTRSASAEGAGQILKQYQDFSAKYGKVVESIEAGPARILVAENTGTYDVVFARDKYFGGATAAPNKDTAKGIVTKWVEQLTK